MIHATRFYPQGNRGREKRIELTRKSLYKIILQCSKREIFDFDKFGMEGLPIIRYSVLTIAIKNDESPT
jgi:hypothetical protein